MQYVIVLTLLLGAAHLQAKGIKREFGAAGREFGKAGMATFRAVKHTGKGTWNTGKTVTNKTAEGLEKCSRSVRRATDEDDQGSRRR